jgi:hypothetical protein
MSNLAKLQEWYFSQCDDDWEHSYGVHVETLDNPGWHLVIDLVGTALSEKPFTEQSLGMGEQAMTSGNEWFHCVVKDNKFVGAGGPRKLEEMIGIFLAWAGAST